MFRFLQFKFFNSILYKLHLALKTVITEFIEIVESHSFQTQNFCSIEEMKSIFLLLHCFIVVTTFMLNITLC